MKLTHFIILGLIVFAADIFTPLQFFDSVFYWIFASLASGICSRKKTYILSVFYSIFILAGLFIAGDYSQAAVFGHLSGITALWILTYFLVRYREAYRREELLRKELEKIYNRIDEIIFGLDKNWNVTYKNTASDKRGYTFVNVGDNFFEKLPDALGTNLEYNFRKAMAEQKPVTFTYTTKYSITPRIITFTAFPSEEGLSVFTKDITDVTEAQQKAEEASAMLNNVINALDDAFWVVDKNFTVIFANDKMLNWSGKKREEILGKNLFEALPELNPLLKEKLSEVMETGKSVKVEMKSSYIQGVYFSFSINPSPDGLSVITQDITNYKEAKIRLQQALEERDLLFKELYHRIKNNLQIISSIVNLESERIEDARAKSIMDNIITRIHSISILHSKLYESESLTLVNISEYIKNILEHLRISYGSSGINFIMEIEDIVINSRCAAPVGMIVSEIVSNSIKHAFPGKNNGNIYISCRRNNGRTELIIRDNGIGYPEYIKESNSFGIQLVNFLAEQLEAKVEMSNRDGAFNKIEFSCN